MVGVLAEISRSRPYLQYLAFAALMMALLER